MRHNRGRLNIISGNASLYFDGEQTKTFPNIPSNFSKPGAVIDFQINTDKPVDISAALGGGEYQHINLRMEALENSSGEHEIKVQEGSARYRNEAFRRACSKFCIKRLF